jgi:nucleoid DNA-binding protein
MKNRLIIIMLFTIFSALHAGSRGREYVVVKGDWLSKLAVQEYGDVEAWKALVKWNPQIPNGNMIYYGERIFIPNKQFLHNPELRDQTIRAGHSDTYKSLSVKMFGLDKRWKAISKWNSHRANIRGMEIKVRKATVNVAVSARRRQKVVAPPPVGLNVKVEEEPEVVEEEDDIADEDNFEEPEEEITEKEAEDEDEFAQEDNASDGAVQQKQAQATSVAAPVSTRPGTKNGQKGWLIKNMTWLVIGVLALLAVVGLVLYFRKKQFKLGSNLDEEISDGLDDAYFDNKSETDSEIYVPVSEVQETATNIVEDISNDTPLEVPTINDTQKNNITDNIEIPEYTGNDDLLDDEDVTEATIDTIGSDVEEPVVEESESIEAPAMPPEPPVTASVSPEVPEVPEIPVMEESLEEDFEEVGGDEIVAEENDEVDGIELPNINEDIDPIIDDVADEDESILDKYSPEFELVDNDETDSAIPAEVAEETDEGPSFDGEEADESIIDMNNEFNPYESKELEEIEGKVGELDDQIAAGERVLDEAAIGEELGDLEGLEEAVNAVESVIDDMEPLVTEEPVAPENNTTLDEIEIDASEELKNIQAEPSENLVNQGFDEGIEESPEEEKEEGRRLTEKIASSILTDNVTSEYERTKEQLITQEQRIQDNMEDLYEPAQIIEEPEAAILKSDIVDNIMEKLDISKSKANESVNEFFEVITHGLKTDGDVRFRELFSFKVKELKSRKGRNPKTGVAVKVGKRKSINFKMGKELFELLNNKKK